MMKKLVSLLLLVGILFSLSITVGAERLFDEVAEPVIGGKYYLCATVDGKDYYYRVTSGALGESVTDTDPYSLYVTDDTSDKNLKEFTLEELSYGFFLGYPSGQNTHKIYSADVTMDGIVDTGINSTLDVKRHVFYWDGDKKQIFTVKDEEKHILAVKMMRNNVNGQEQMHMLSVPEAEVAEGKAFPVRFVTSHQCQFSSDLASNEYSHWHPCHCGEKNQLQLHQVAEWTVTKEAAVGEEGSRTGTCTVCGAKAEESIPALKDKNEPTEAKEENQTEEPTTVKPDLTAIVAAAALVILGAFILIFGNKKKKQ